MSEWREALHQRLDPLMLRPEREAEIVEELSHHLDDHVRERIAAGAPPETARGEALAELDSWGPLAAYLAATERRLPDLPPPGQPSGGRWLRDRWADLRLAVRALRHRPAFTATVVVTMALTIGPLTAMVSVGRWLLWNPTPAVTAPQRLVVIWVGQWTAPNAVSPRGVSYLNLDDLRKASRTLSGLAGWQETMVSVAIPGHTPRRVQGGFVTANFFSVLGVDPSAGRAFTMAEDRPPYGVPVIVIGESLARQAFGGADAALSQTILINGRPMTVIGVMPAAFAGAHPTSRVDVWYTGAAYAYVHHYSEAAAARHATRVSGLFYSFVGKLADSASAEQAQAELDVLVPGLADEHADDNAAFAAVRARVFAGLGPPALMRARLTELVDGLLIVGGVLLLLGCANVTNILLAHGVRRQHERAVRLALGASRMRLMQQVLTESVVLALAGAAVGVALAVWLKHAIVVLLLPALWGEAARPNVPLDGTVLLVTLGAAIACGVLVGAVPAWMGGRAHVAEALGRAGSRATMRSPRLRMGLAAMQLGLSLALVIGALLLVASLRNLSHVELGFNPHNVSIHSLGLREHGYSAAQALAYNRSLLERLHADGSLEAASISSGYPFAATTIEQLQVPGDASNGTLPVRTIQCTEGFADVLGMTLHHGRFFVPDEVLLASSPPVGIVVVSESLAQRLFATTHVLGRRVTLTGSPTRDLEVIGVMRDVPATSRRDGADLMMYLPMTGDDMQLMFPVVLTRSASPLRLVHAAVASAAMAIDPALPVSEPLSLLAYIARGTANQRAFAWVLSLLGCVGCILAAVGLYGLLMQSVGERHRELGIRLAIGATQAHVLRLVLRRAMWLCLVGIGMGLVLAGLGSGLLEVHLYGVTAWDPRVYTLAAAGLALVVFTASIWPAVAATRVNPVETLRTE